MPPFYIRDSRIANEFWEWLRVYGYFALFSPCTSTPLISVDAAKHATCSEHRKSRANLRLSMHRSRKDIQQEKHVGSLNPHENR